MNEFKVPTFTEHLNELEVKNKQAFYSTGYHIISILNYKELEAVSKKFKHPQTIAVLSGVNYLTSILKTKSIKELDKAFIKLRGLKVNSLVVFDANKKEFYKIMNPGESMVKLDKNDSSRGISASDWTRGGHESYLDVEREIEIAKTDFINDYERIGAEIRK